MRPTAVVLTLLLTASLVASCQARVSPDARASAAVGPSSESVGAAAGANDPASDATALVDAMVQAHGGMDAWRRLSTVGFQHVLFRPGAPEPLLPWRVHRTVADLATGALTHGHAQVDAMWSPAGEDFGGRLARHPEALAGRAFEVAFLPWLARGEDVVAVRSAGEDSLPGRAGVLRLVEVDRGPDRDLYTLYIDPDSAVLRGARVTFRDRARLDALGHGADVREAPGTTEIVDRWAAVAGLRVPVQFHGRDPAGAPTGYHVLERFAVDVEPSAYLGERQRAGERGDRAPSTARASASGPTASVATAASVATLGAEEILSRTVAAHGGSGTFAAARAVRFDNYFFNPHFEASGWQSPWWVVREAIDPASGAVRQDWPLRDARIGYDGETVWSENYGLGNPPSFQLYFFYYFLHLPFLAEQDIVRLGEPDVGALPGVEGELVTIEIGFRESPAIGKSPRDGYRLYIDPETFLLRGYEYWIGWAPMLRVFGMDEADTFGPLLRVIDRYTTADGLVVPAMMHTLPGDGSRTIGHHLLLNFDYRTPLEQRSTTPPPAAVADSLAGEP